MTSIFHEPHDKFLLAGQAARLAHPAQFPRFILGAGKKNSIEVSGANPLLLWQKSPEKQWQSGGQWGITEPLPALGGC